MENEKLNEDFTEALKENSEKKYDMILVIVNKGYTDLVMEAARRNGASHAAFRRLRSRSPLTRTAL